MRVLHVAAYYAPAYVYGGPPGSIHGLCRALWRHGIGIQVFTTDANGPTALPREITDAQEFEGVPVRYFPRTWPEWPIGSNELAWTLRRTIRDVEVLHIHGLWNRVVWAAAREARRAGVPYVLSPRGMLLDGALAHRAWRKRIAYAAIERRTLEGAAMIHVTSADERDAVRALRPVAPIQLIPNGIELGHAAPLDVRTSPPVVLFVGRIHPIKRLDLLLDAFLRVVGHRPDAKLVVAGPDELGLRARLAQRHPALASHVEWVGAVTPGQRDEWLRRARMLVLCSDSESFGMSILEAMAAARPVVVAKTCGWPEIASAGFGVRVEQQSESIAAGILRLLDDPAEASAMGARGLAIAEQQFSWPTVAAAFVRAYHLIQRRPATRAAEPLRA